MDITQNELKVMKAKQLRRIIREAIEEILAENIAVKVTGKSGESSVQSFPNMTAANNLKSQNTNISSVKQLEEDNIDEAKGYKLTNPGMDINQFTNKRTGEPAKIAGLLFSDILAAIRDTEGISDKQLFDRFKFNPETGVGFKKVQQLNGMMKGLKDAGVVNRLGKGGDIETAPEPGEEAPTKATEPEDLFMGGTTDPLSMYFDDKPNADGSEDFTDSTEPETGELEKAEPTTSSMSDEDYEAFMKYDELKRRLDATKSNILKTRKSRTTAGDISDKPSTELVRLRDLKKSLEDRINTLVAGSDYLKKKLAKDMPAAPPVETPDEEETLEEGLDEWTINKMKYYAGITK